VRGVAFACTIDVVFAARSWDVGMPIEAFVVLVLAAALVALGLADRPPPLGGMRSTLYPAVVVCGSLLSWILMPVLVARADIGGAAALAATCLLFAAAARRRAAVVSARRDDLQRRLRLLDRRRKERRPPR